jgi:hypothetical protein
MRKLLLAVLAIAVSPPLFAQNSGNITSNQSVCIGVSAEHSTVAVQVTGTWTGTLQPQVAVQGQAATNSQVVPSTSTTPAATITANGVYYANVGGLSQFCILGNTVASGTAVIYLNVSKGVNASTLGGGGAGSGTVTNTGGNLTLNSVVLGAGTVDTKVSTGITTNGASELDLGVAGTNGVLGLKGSTSGTSTLTAPATAGTSTNPVVATNVWSSPVGAAATPAYSFTGFLGYGMWLDSSNGVAFSDSGTERFVTVSNALKLNNNEILNWAASSLPGGSADVGFSRQGVNMLALGNATANDETGLLRSGNTCRITADVSLTVNVANSFCSFTLPAVAKAWAFRCDVQWAITAGSGTTTFALGVNPSQTPTGTTNGEAQVYTATSGTQTMGSTAISASGATVILTGATYTPAATVQLAKISGTLLASGTGGTFAIQATANGTTATAAVKAGSACWLN